MDICIIVGSVRSFIIHFIDLGRGNVLPRTIAARILAFGTCLSQFGDGLVEVVIALFLVDGMRSVQGDLETNEEKS